MADQQVTETFRCKVYLIPEGDGFSVVSATLPGVASQGESEEEALKNIVEAFEGALAVYRERSQPIPWQRARRPERGALTRTVTIHG